MVVKWCICDEDFRQNVIFASTYSGRSKIYLSLGLERCWARLEQWLPRFMHSFTYCSRFFAGASSECLGFVPLFTVSTNTRNVFCIQF